MDRALRELQTQLADAAATRLSCSMRIIFCAALFEDTSPDLEVYWHRLIVVTGMNARLGDVIGRMKIQPEHAGRRRDRQ